MAKTIIEVDLQIKGDDTVGNAEGKVKSLKTELKELKTLLASGTLDENQFSKLAARAGELQDKIGDVNQQVKNLASDGKALDGFVGLTEGIVGGFTAVQGITALVGDENEDLNKTLVKIQASMAVLNGLQALNNTLQKQSSAVLLLNSIQTKALAAAQTLYAFATGGATLATKAFRIALIATGIGAVVVLLASAASAMGVFGDSVDDTTESLKKQKEELDDYNQRVNELNTLSLNNVKRQSEIDKARLKLQGATNSKLLEEDLKFLKAKLSFDEQAFKASTEGTERRKAQDQFSQTESEIALKRLEILQAQKDEKQKALDAKSKEQKVKDIKKRSPDFQAQLDNLVKEEEELAEARRKAEEERLKLEKEANEKRLEEQKALNEAIILGEYSLQDAKLGIASQGVELIGALGQKNKALADAAFFLQKGIAIAEVVINTQREIAGIYANPTLTLLPDAGVTIKTSLAAAAKIRAGLSIATIAATAIGKGSANSSGGGGGGAGQSSQPKPIQGFIPEGQATEGRPTGAQRVYVLEKDITDSQGRVARIRNNATLK